MTQFKYEQDNSEIIAIYSAAGKTIPAFDSAEGFAISIIQSIIDENHKLPELELFRFKAFDFSDYSKTCDTEEESQLEYVADVTGAKEEYKENILAEYSELFDIIEEIEGNIGNDDFYIDYDGIQYRLISGGCLWETYVDTIKDTVENCYNLNLNNIPSFVSFSIDWEETAKNCLVDGYAHTFSSYDGDFHIEVNDYNIFWTN